LLKRGKGQVGVLTIYYLNYNVPPKSNPKIVRENFYIEDETAFKILQTMYKPRKAISTLVIANREQAAMRSGQ